MKTKIKATNFGRIVEEVPAHKFDCAMTHIYINNPSDEATKYLINLAKKLPAEKLEGCMVHLNDSVENLLEFFEVR